MPVRWLYVLKDGSLVAPDVAATGNAISIQGVTSANPVVGRIAFWTDDETCRININTASEGTFWDTPRGASTTEQSLANYQPSQKEYQRYPAHPAMTCLSTVFPKSASQTDQQWAEQIYQIIPRIKGGAGTSLEGSTIVAAGSVAPVTPDPDRLFADVDELIFDPARGPSTILDRGKIQQAKFFLTAHSRAPEVNLFNLPRIACWPVYRLNGGNFDSKKTTAFDRQIATCSTVNGKPYYFQREKAGSWGNDIAISRNTQLYGYLRYLTSQQVPGFGGNFFTKYGDDRDQLLTEIFDYIRSTNLYDDNLTQGNQFTAIANSPGHGWVVPTRYQPGSKMTQGFGRSFTMSEFGIGFICNAVADDPATAGMDESSGSNDPSSNKVLNGSALAPGEKYIQAIIVFELFSPMLGWTSLGPDMQVEITGLDGLSVRTQAERRLISGSPVRHQFRMTRISLICSAAWRGAGIRGGAIVCSPKAHQPEEAFLEIIRHLVGQLSVYRDSRQNPDSRPQGEP